MALPILVPQHHEMALLGVRFRSAQTQRLPRWRACHRTRSRPVQEPGRQGRFATPDPATMRSALLVRWQRQRDVWVRLPKPAPITWQPGTASSYRTLLKEAESVLHLLLRRRRHALDVHPRDLTALAMSFDIQRWRVRLESRQHHAFALLLCAMYWRGCRIPLAINSAPHHPSTALVRWLSQFTVQQQADHGRQILNTLAAEEKRVHQVAFELARRLLPSEGKPPRWAVVLPELIDLLNRKHDRSQHYYYSRE